MVVDKKGVHMNKRVTQVVILAGGLGTRLEPFTNISPKPMYPINNVPFIDYLMHQMKMFGMKEVLFLLGYLPEKIIDYFGDGSRYGLTINYDITPVDYDTGMRIKHAVSQIADKFLLLYCDNYCPINYSKLCADFWNNKAKIQITAYSNRDNYTKSNFQTQTCCVSRSGWYDKQTPGTSLLHRKTRGVCLAFGSDGSNSFVERKWISCNYNYQSTRNCTR